MTVQPKAPSTINQYLAKPLTVGEPDISGALVVYPVFGAEPRLVYISLVQAHTQGFIVKELPGEASVRDLLVQNPLSVPVLIYEGEGVTGAQQNRTVDKSVLVGPGEQVRIPVSCVEAGRWDSERHLESFEPAPQTIQPGLRGSKSRQAARARYAGAEERADQTAVWESVSACAFDLGVDSDTESIDEIYETHREKLNQVSAGIHLRDGQIGSVVQIANQVKAVDLVSRSDVFAEIHAALVQGYSLDALAMDEQGDRSWDTDLGGQFLDEAMAARIHEADGIGMGRDFRFESAGMAGAGLVSGDELIQLSVFSGEPETITASEEDEPADFTAWIDRPSRRNR